MGGAASDTNGLTERGYSGQAPYAGVTPTAAPGWLCPGVAAVYFGRWKAVGGAPKGAAGYFGTSNGPTEANCWSAAATGGTGLGTGCDGCVRQYRRPAQVIADRMCFQYQHDTIRAVWCPAQYLGPGTECGHFFDQS